jgi:hypothetical protein
MLLPKYYCTREKRNAYKVLVRNPEAKRVFGIRPTRTR